MELYLLKQREVDAPNLGQVGDVKTSILTETQFQAIHGTQWVLMDGRNVSGSQYHIITGNTTIPDARGQFLRGKNNGRADGNQDPAGERNTGTFQNDAMQGHQHEVSVASANVGDNGALAYATNTPADGTRQILNPITDGVNGSPRTASETRVKNIAVNYFVKID